MDKEREKTWKERLNKQKERLMWIIKGLNKDDLTDWEMTFFESLEERVNNGVWLSDRQVEISEKIYREKSR